MLVAAAFAVLLAGAGAPAQSPSEMTPPAQETVAPVSRPKLPLSFSVDAGWTTTRQFDPYGRSGVTSFDTQMPQLGMRLTSSSWYVELTGQLLLSRLRDRNVSGAVRRDVFRTGPLRWGLGLEVTDVRFRREDFRTEDILIGTSREAAVGLGAVSVGIGPYRGARFRVTALAGVYRNRYGSAIELPGYTGDEPLADDDATVVGGRFAVDGVALADRLELGGSVRYLRLIGGHSPSIPGDEISGTASLDVRLFGIRKKQLYVGAFVRLGPSGPGLITDKTFGLRGIWRLR